MNAVTDAIADAVPASKLVLAVVVGEPVALEMYQVGWSWSDCCV